MPPPASHAREPPRCPCRRRPAPPARWSRREGCRSSAWWCPAPSAPHPHAGSAPPWSRDAPRGCRPQPPFRSKAGGTQPPAMHGPERSPEAAFPDASPNTAPSPRSGAAPARRDGCPGRTRAPPSRHRRQDAAIPSAPQPAPAPHTVLPASPPAATSSTPGAPAPPRAGPAGSPMSRQHPPARRTVRGPGMLGADIAVRQHRPITMPCFPVVRNPTRRLRQHMRGKVRNPHRRQEQEAVVVHYPPQSRATGSCAPANIPVPRLLVPARRAEADPTQTPEPRRYHQIVQRFAGMPRNPLRMVRRHHRTEAPRTLATLGRFQRHRPQSRQRRLHMQVRMRRQCIPRRRRRCRRRKPQPQLRRQPRQDLPRRRNARLAPRVAPLRASAQLARKRAPARASLPDRALKPRKRFRAKLSQANLHASCMPQNPARVNSVIVTGSGRLSRRAPLPVSVRTTVHPAASRF